MSACLVHHCTVLFCLSCHCQHRTHYLCFTACTLFCALMLYTASKLRSRLHSSQPLPDFTTTVLCWCFEIVRVVMPNRLYYAFLEANENKDGSWGLSKLQEGEAYDLPFLHTHSAGLCPLLEVACPEYHLDTGPVCVQVDHHHLCYGMLLNSVDYIVDSGGSPCRGLPRMATASLTFPWPWSFCTAKPGLLPGIQLYWLDGHSKPSSCWWAY